MQYPGFIGGDYQVQSRIVSPTRSINLYPEIVAAENGKNKIALYGTPGLQYFTNLPTQPGRGLWAGDNRLFAVSGSHLYEVFVDGTFHDLGSINQGGGPLPITPAQIFTNTAVGGGNQLFIVSGQQGYIADGLSILPVVPAVQGGFLNGRFLAQVPDSNQFQCSALEDGKTWDGTLIFTKEGAADRLRAIFTDHELLWLLGEETSEVWEVTTDPFAPYQPIPGAFIEQGCIAPYSPQKLDNSLFWLSSSQRGSGIVYRSQGFSPMRVSNHAMEYAISTYPQIYDAVGSSYEDRGHLFYRLDFPSGTPYPGGPVVGATWVYDATTQMWHERMYLDPNTGVYMAHRARFHAATALGGGQVRHFVQDYTNGNIYVQDLGTYIDQTAQNTSNAIRRVRRAPHLTNEQKWTRYRALRIDMEVGTGPQAGQGSIPQMAIRWSDDGGYTWTSEKTFSQFEAGDYWARALWRRLGRSRDRVFEWSTSEPIPIALVDAYLDVAEGTGA